jgi:hypothetical protein
MKEQQPLVWSDEAPTEAGYYWWRQTPEESPVPVRVRLGDGMNCRDFRMYLAGNSNSFGVDGGQWAGPLVPPANEPQEQEWWCSQCGAAMDAAKAQKRLTNEGILYCDTCKQWWVDNPPIPQEQEWVRLDSLRPGAIFETQEGKRAVKRWSGRLYEDNHKVEATSLESGTYMLFHCSDTELVREIAIG